MSTAAGSGPEVTEVAVDRGAVGDDVLLALARARTVAGPAGLVAAVRHLCPPRARLVVGDPPPDAEEPVVRLVQGGLSALLDGVTPADPGATAAARRRYAELAQPPGALGRLEDVGARIAGMVGRASPAAPSRPVVVVAAADHGVVARGVTIWPPEVTAAMFRTVAAGGAGVNAVARTVGARIVLLDVGLADSADLGPSGGPHAVPATGAGSGVGTGDAAATPGDEVTVIRDRIRPGTADLAAGSAMTVAEATRAVLAGARATTAAIGAGADLVVPGDLGIGNTTASSALVAVLTGARADLVVGRGAGADAATLERKRAVVTAVADRWSGREPDGLAVLADCGGLEHGALVGVVLAAAGHRVPVILDGAASVAAALVAARLCPDVVHAVVAGHRSVEPSSGVGLEYLGATPMLDLSLGLGEGTGGLLAVPLVQAAVRCLTDMALLRDVAG